MGAALLALGLVAYNNAANRWTPFLGAAYVPMNLAVAAGVLALGAGALDLDARGIGLTEGLSLGWLGLAGAAALGAPLVAAALHPRAARLVADERARGLGGARLAYHATVRIPLGTAVLEEVAFRGVLFAAWRAHGTVAAALLSSAAFGVWHVSPALNLLRANRPRASARAAVAAVAGAVAVTFGAGLALCWMRVRSGGLALPFALHAALNSLATVAAAMAHRRADTAPLADPNA